MPFTATVARGFTMTAGYRPTVDDWNALGLPTVDVSGTVDAGDISDSAITFSKLNPNFVISGTAMTALAVDDLLLVGDVSASGNRVITVANALNGIFSLAATAATAFTSYSADRITLYNGTAAVTMTPARLAEQLVAQAPALTATDDTDEVLVHDASATDGSQATRVALANLLPDKGTAGTYTGVTGFTTDSKGRVITVVTTGTGARYTTPSPVTLPTGAGYANGVDITTGLGARPGFVSAYLQCTDAAGDAGWSQNDIIPMDWVVFDTSASTYYNGRYGLIPNGSAGVLRLVQPDNGGTGPRVIHKTTGDDTAFTTTKWKLILDAIR